MVEDRGQCSRAKGSLRQLARRGVLPKTQPLNQPIVIFDKRDVSGFVIRVPRFADTAWVLQRLQRAIHVVCLVGSF